MNMLKPIKITFREKELLIWEYAQYHSSPSTWIKDLIKADMEKSEYPYNNLNTNNKSI